MFYGFWDIALPVLNTAISTGGQVYSAVINKEAAKTVAEIQAQTAQAQLATQERLAQLQLEALKSSNLNTASSSAYRPTTEYVPEPTVAGLVTGQVGGFPVIYLLLGGLLLFLLIKKD